MGWRGHARHRRKRQAYPQERLRKNKIGSDDENACRQSGQHHHRLQRNQKRNLSDVDAGMADDVQTPLRFAPHVRAVFEQREKYVIPRIRRHENRRDYRSYAATSVQQDDFGRVRIGDRQEIEIFARSVF